MAKNITLKDKSGNQLLPVTSAANVFMADSRTVESLVLDISNNAIKYELSTSTDDANAQQTATFDSAGNNIVNTYATKEEIPISLPLGTIIPAAIPLTDAGVHLLDGSTITQTGIYSAFTTYLRSLQSTYSNLFCTESEWQNINTINGECGKFVINDSNNTIRLPKLTHIIQGTVNLTTIGDSIAPGLPNITGAFYTDMKLNASNYTATGPFSTKTTSYSAFSSRSSESDSSITGFEFDASLASPLYGASNTVQPRTLLYPYYIVVANNISKKDVDFAKIATDLNGKVSTVDAPNIIKTEYQKLHRVELLYSGSISTGASCNLGVNLTTLEAPMLYVEFKVSNMYFGATIPTFLARAHYNTSDTRYVASTDSVWAAFYFPTDTTFVVNDIGSNVNTVFVYACY